MKFADAYNPTDAELRQWAADPNALYPDEVSQDWDLIVADWSRVDLISELAAEVCCPQRVFFLSLLYILAGDSVRNGRDIVHLHWLLQRLEETPSESLRLFRARSLALLADPATFNYSLWCDGGYAHGPTEQK